ncbi:hypothetical protein BD410DRAFT_797598 [Rickenella mellea]|uniref:Hydrophobin n=1 Tax=Rickenella mellea TaxID=50990 RepID=A0A4Y7PDV4_9AGAM|nr:hypothetical protein BD410DRAFT_797598 [Rickenella mellea]
MQFTLLTVAFVALASGVFAQQCSTDGDKIFCTDARAACATVQSTRIDVDGTLRVIGASGSAQVVLTRAASSTTSEDMNALCNQIVDTCCASGDTMTKSTIALQSTEQGSVQIIPIAQGVPGEPIFFSTS